MAKFPTEVEKSVTVHVPLKEVYAYLWDVVGSSACVPGLASCKTTTKDTYRFIFEERSTGPFTLSVQYTARYEGNGKDHITFESTSAKNDNSDCKGTIRLQPSGSGATRITLKQLIAPDTPVPRLLQGLVRSFVEREAAEAVKQYLANVKSALEGRA
jgi:carbon monoxide dehydrogenase subunit G